MEPAGTQGTDGTRLNNSGCIYGLDVKFGQTTCYFLDPGCIFGLEDNSEETTCYLFILIAFLKSVVNISGFR